MAFKILANISHSNEIGSSEKERCVTSGGTFPYVWRPRKSRILQAPSFIQSLVSMITQARNFQAGEWQHSSRCSQLERTNVTNQMFSKALQMPLKNPSLGPVTLFSSNIAVIFN